MHLIIDIGNTNIVFAVYNKKKINYKWRIATLVNRTQDEYFLWFKETIPDKNFIKDIIVGSVVPEVVIEIKEACKKYFKRKIYTINENIKITLPTEVEYPSEVGADRIVNSLYAWENYKKASVVLDFGTATTFDVVSNKGVYLGGVICPGVNLSLNALQNAAAKLPRIAISKPDKVIGNNTINAMSSGIYWGYIGLINCVLKQIKEELGYELKIMATGGLANFFVKELPTDIIINKDLTVHGLYLAYEKYKTES